MKKVPLYVNYIRRSDPGSIEVKNRLKNGQIENPLKGLYGIQKE